MAAGAPAEHSHLRAVDNSLRDQVIDTGHDVFVALLEIVADDVGLVHLTVVGGPAVIRQQHRVTGTRISLRTISAVEAEHVGGGRSAVYRHDQRIAIAS